MLIGEYHYTIDNKGRLAIPAKLRKHFIEGIIITRGLENCLFIFSINEWQKLVEKLKNLPLAQANSRAFSRLIFSGAIESELDSQGRVGIPEYLRKYANLEKKVVIVGVYNRLEIWDEDKWQKYRKETEDSVIDIAEALTDWGI